MDKLIRWCKHVLCRFVSGESRICVRYPDINLVSELPASIILAAGNTFYLFQIAPERQRINDMAADLSIRIAKSLAGLDHAFEGPALFLPYKCSAVFNLGECQMKRAHGYNVVALIQSGSQL